MSPKGHRTETELLRNNDQLTGRTGSVFRVPAVLFDSRPSDAGVASAAAGVALSVRCGLAEKHANTGWGVPRLSSQLYSPRGRAASNDVSAPHVPPKRKSTQVHCVIVIPAAGEQS